MHIRRLTPDDASAFQALRLSALLEEPLAFGASHEEEFAFPASTISARLAPQVDRGPFGAFEGTRLVGLVALGRENLGKLRHKALVWGLYVAPEFRARGVGRALLMEALALARSVPDILQVNLSVNAANAGAIALYESVGFEAFGFEAGAMRVDGRLHDELHMALRLSGAASQKARPSLQVAMPPPVPSAVDVATEFWRLMATNDFHSVSAVLSPDFVLEWPQSGERIRGAMNFAMMNAEYPSHGPWVFQVHRVVGGASEAVSDVGVTDGVQVGRATSFFTVAGSVITRLVEFWPEPFDAPAHRARWVERMA